MNSFPPVPADFELASVEYDASFPQGSQLAPGLTFTGTQTNVIALGAFGVGGLAMFTFDAPGQFGSFDQAAAEASVKVMLDDCCQFLADVTATALSVVQSGVTVTRRWTWTNAAGDQARHADTMPYPALGAAGGPEEGEVGEIKDLQLVGGDLVASGRGFATVTGPDYVRQRVACALSEPYGSDPYNPSWGSALPGWLGAPQGPGAQAMVAAEAQRVLSALMAAQQFMLKAAAMTGTRSQLSSAEVIARVNGVTASSGGRPDAVQVTVTLTTMGGQQVTASRTVSA